MPHTTPPAAMAEPAVLATPAPAFSLDEARDIAQRHYAVTADARMLVSERDQNFRLRTDDGDAYVLKIANPEEKPDVLAFQTAALRHIKAQARSLPVPEVRGSVAGADLETVEKDGQRYLVRLVSFLPGQLLGEVAVTPSLRRSIGTVLARLDVALRGFFHPAAGHDLLWDLSHAARLRPLIEHFDDPLVREQIARVIDNFDTRVRPVLPSLRAQVIHNDFNPANLLVANNAPDRIGGIIDFGDLVHAPLVNNLAVAIAYQVLDDEDQIPAVCDIVGAYHAVQPLAEEECGMLYDLIATRMAQSLTIGAWRAKSHPENADYILADQAAFESALERWLKHDREDVGRLLRACCGVPASLVTDGAGDESLKRRRRQALGPALRLTYEAPLHIVRGDGVWLHDACGRRVLDAYNNVASVGHSHPEVVAALSRQAATLNTNTRYLHENIVEYAERLTGTLPPQLSVCLFVCTGTEANDLAWQIARACTGGDGAIVTDHAYHGNSTIVSQLSPEELAPGQQEDWVATVPAPNTYSGPYRADESAVGERYAAHLDQAIESLRGRGHRPAAFFVDTAYTSDGIFVAPDGYLALAWRRVRDAGGLCIADEVQAGFGRTGDFMWGFEQQGVLPDIVTLGKPIGNGHPLAAVITTPALAERFAARRYYFNTFGGNPVSCAVGLTVLDVLQRERLQENARTAGTYLRGELERRQARHEVIGDVRGAGLFTGVELVRDRASRQPATEVCGAALNGMRERGVLIGRTGLHSHVLKIRPPLVFSTAHADLLVEALDDVLTRHG